MSLWTSDSENVQRILSDMKPDPGFWCRFGLHAWARWEVMLKGKDVYGIYFEKCRRECKYCGRPQVKEFKE